MLLIQLSTISLVILFLKRTDLNIVKRKRITLRLSHPLLFNYYLPQHLILLFDKTKSFGHYTALLIY